ncbi:MAG: YggS family pyridoxal phosphate-dependent enzyme [Gemmatimonadales bacterium]|jgi:pyridoxal phosphate enzyme (YggS family)
MTFDALPGNLVRVRERIADVQAREGLSGEVRIVAVTKGHGPEAARAAVRAGLVDLGESRVQEAVAKLDELTDLGAVWHLIGHLQTNKAKFVPGRFRMVHSVDSVKVAAAMAKACARAADTNGPVAEAVDVLVQVNVAGEAQKYGSDPAEAEAVVQRVSEAARLRLRGLMTMAPFTDDEAVQRRVFSDLRAMRDRLEAAGYPLPELSMGMSDDYAAAVAEGATMVRLGTVLFGERPT